MTTPNTNRILTTILFLTLFAAYLVTYTGVIQSSDGLAMFAVTESIVRRGEIDTNQLLWMGLQQGSFGPDGELYSRKGFGMTLLALPLVWLAQSLPNWLAAFNMDARWLGDFGLVQVALLLNPILTAWTGVLIFLTGRRWGWSEPVSVGTALIFGLATMAWPYTQTFFSDPVCMWGLMAAFYNLACYQQEQGKRFLFWAGMAWGLAYVARVINLITLPIYGIALLTLLIQNTEDAHKNLLQKLRQNWRELTSFVVPVVAAGLSSLWWNWVRYGHVFDSGYVESESFSAIWVDGLYGLLFGPARGIFWYSPILILGIFGIGWFWRHQRWSLITMLAIALVYIGVYGKWYMWHGGFSWGPRFMLPLMPFLALLMGPTLLSLSSRWTGKIVFIALIMLSIVIQWLGLSVPFGLVQNWLQHNVQPLFAPETFTQIRYSPLVLQWQFLLSPSGSNPAMLGEHSQLWWLQPNTQWSYLLLPLSGLLIGLMYLTLVMNDTYRSQAIKRLVIFASTLVVLLTCVTIVQESSVQESSVQESSAGKSALIAQVTDNLSMRERDGDAILLLQPLQTQPFANTYDGRLPTYGLFPQGELDDTNQTWQTYIVNNYHRIWVIPDYTPADQSGWEQPLRADDFLLWEQRFSTPVEEQNPDEQNSEEQTSDMRLALYAPSNQHPLVESGIGAIFGAPLNEIEATQPMTEPITANNGWIRLMGYGLTPQTAPGNLLLLSLQWQSLATIDANYHVFVHLLDSNNEKVAQRDGQPVQWMRPTSTWALDEKIVDNYGFLLPRDLLAGEYTIAIGFYDPVTGERLPTGAGTPDFALRLGPIVVVE
ncbi:MAG: hypothetical protein AAF639_35135 [Chloroflexota bacterium]